MASVPDRSGASRRIGADSAPLVAQQASAHLVRPSFLTPVLASS
ncbi:hypothetical protein [Streptomyces sp. NPDC024089]